ncbi:MAG TPA: hypothetical protein VFD47_08695 [Actinomycetota bacterium]|nr:hypothetical protein [Actinomycetota bacterium]
MQLFFALAIGWVLSEVILHWAGGHIKRATTGLPEGIGFPEHLLFAIVAFVAFSASLMLLHALTRGWVFSNPVVIPALGVAILVAGVFRRPKAGRRHGPSLAAWIPAVVLGLVLVAIFVEPVIAEGSGVRAGDSSLHMGWTEQILRGESVPPGPAPELARNAYPWGFHAVMATMIRLVPGTGTFIAQEAMHLLFLLGLPLGCACLARRLNSGAGWAGAVCGSLIAGWGWVSARRVDFVATPLEARYGADMVTASPNSVYELFPPGLPRELGLVILAAAGVLIMLAVRTEDRRFALLAGAVVGFVGLISVPLWITGIVWAALGVALTGAGARRRMVGALIGPGVLVFGIWAGPVAFNYIRYGGFINVTSQLGVEWPPLTALAAWGLLLPLALAGVVLAWRSGTTSARVILSFAGATVVLMLLARARSEFGWDLAGNATALHQGRIWPVAHLLGAAFAGAGLAAGFMWMRRRSEFLAPVAVTVLVVVGSLSLWLSSQALTEIINKHEKSWLYTLEEFAPDAFISEAAVQLGPDVVVQAPQDENNVLGFWLFQFSGARVNGHSDSRYPGNELRIRYEDLASRYGEVMDSGGFEVDYIPMPASEAAGIPEEAIVAEGPFRGESWVLVEAAAAE